MRVSVHQGAAEWASGNAIQVMNAHGHLDTPLLLWHRGVWLVG
jgi:hypothetical protein